MTDETKAREGEVTQADREAAADYLRFIGSESMADWIAGKAALPRGWEGQTPNKHSLVEAFARHRLAALSSATPAEDVVERIELPVVTCNGVGAYVPLASAEKAMEQVYAFTNQRVAQMQAEIERLRRAHVLQARRHLEQGLRAETAEAKLAEAVEAFKEAFEFGRSSMPWDVERRLDTTLARIKETSNG